MEVAGQWPCSAQCSESGKGAREPLFQAWDTQFARQYDFAGKGKAGHKAVWHSMFGDEAYADTGIVSTTLLTGLATCI